MLRLTLVAIILIAPACAVAVVPLPSCPEVGCAFAPGPAMDPDDGAGLWCPSDDDAPCLCRLPDQPDTWCMPTEAQLSPSSD